MVLGKTNNWTKVFAGIGLFEQSLPFTALSLAIQGKYLRWQEPVFFHPFFPAEQRFRTPNNALIAGRVVGLISIFTGTTDKVIIISALGAVLMYCISMVALYL